MYPLFETIRIKNGNPQYLEYHQERMEVSYNAYYKRYAKMRIQDEMKIPYNCSSGMCKCKLSYNESGMKAEFSEYKMRKIQSLKLVEGNSISYSLKYSDRRALDDLFEKRGECDDVLILKNNLITDSSVSNIVFYDGFRWYTPRKPLLAGTQRKRLIRQKFLIERNIRIEDVKKYKSFKLINAMRDFDELEEVGIENIVF